MYITPIDDGPPRFVSLAEEQVVDWSLHALRVEEAWRFTRGKGLST
jgi:hypothetical protein